MANRPNMDGSGALPNEEEGPPSRPQTPQDQVIDPDDVETPWAPKRSRVPCGIKPPRPIRPFANSRQPNDPTLTFVERLEQAAEQDQGPQQRGSSSSGPHQAFHPLRDGAGLPFRPPRAPSTPTPAPRYTARAHALANATVMNPFSDRSRAGPSTPVQSQHQQQSQTPSQHQQQHYQQQQQSQAGQYQQQHAPAHGQHFAAMNGMNGGPVPGGMVSMPTPAGHQSELNYIYSLVEELSKQLADNRRQTEEIVSGIGRVRNRARNQALGNEELINAASDEINGEEKNLDSLVSVLTEALETAKHSRDANASLLQEYSTAMRNMLRQVHDYKANQVEEISSWHRSYRSQLAAEREENCRLREQIWEMHGRAGNANESLREFRRRYEESEERWNRRVDNTAMRQEIRFWKRMAMPEVPDDDPYWSDDDDLIDIREKVRLREEQQAREQQEQLAQQQEDAADIEEHGLLPTAEGQAPASGVFGGVAMQRDEAAPALPARPASAASTGSSGQ